MKKNIWIMNHYATNMYFNEGGRHHWFAKNLINEGYKPTIFCANTIHNTEDIIVISTGKYVKREKEKIPYIFIKTPTYKGNGFQRLWNMFVFFKNLFPVATDYAKTHGKPDVIIASSVHPLTLVAGVKIAKKFGIPCICEVRDLWPESFVAYNIIKKNNPILKILYAGEKWIYKKADKLIFTMEGGKDYIIEKGWNKENGGPIDLDKVYHINNGVDLEKFRHNLENNTIIDKELDNDQVFKVIYTGSIRQVNQLGLLLDVAKFLQNTGYDDIVFLIYGYGDQVEVLKQRLLKEGINNVYFKGRIEKKYIPYILSKGDLNIIVGANNPLYKYGLSPNKLFDYLASGKPTLSTISSKYSILEKYGAGKEIKDSNIETIADTIVDFKTMSPEMYKQYSDNSLKAANDYDFKVLTKKLLTLINNEKINIKD